MAQERIGFIGVGFMGHGMAKNIVEKGYPLTVMAHRNRTPVDDLVRRGATEAKSPREVAAASTIVFLCVTGSKQVEDLSLGPDGLMAGAAKGSVVVDASTSDPTSTLRLAPPSRRRTQPSWTLRSPALRRRPGRAPSTPW